MQNLLKNFPDIMELLQNLKPATQHTKALSVKQPFASLLESGMKTAEIRKYRTHYRGLLAICASAAPFSPHEIHGMLGSRPYPSTHNKLAILLGMVALDDCIEITASNIHEFADRAYMLPSAIETYADGRKVYAWMMRPVEMLEPISVKGQLRIFDLQLPI